MVTGVMNWIRPRRDYLLHKVTWARHKSSRHADAMRSAFADSNWATMERFKDVCSRTGPD
jgi:hypothetical protein